MMKPNLVLTLLVLLGSMGVTKAFSQSLVVRLQDGSEQTADLSTVRKLTFENGNLVVSLYSASNSTYGLSTVSKVVFYNVPAGIDDIASDQSAGLILIYYKPAEGTIYFSNLPSETSQVSVYRINGTTAIKTQLAAGESTLDVNALTQGIYILKIRNQVFKFIKQ